MLAEVILSLLWIGGAFTGIATLILWLVRGRLGHRREMATAIPLVPCASVRPGPDPVQVTGVTAPGPAGPLRATLAGTTCVWSGLSVCRRFEEEYYDVVAEDIRTRIRDAEVWAWDSGPLGLRDGSGGVLLASALLHKTVNVLGYPREQFFEEYREWPERPGGPFARLVTSGLLPPAVLEPTEATLGFLVTEYAVLAGRPISVLATVGALGGVPILAAPLPGMAAISQKPQAGVMARGRRRLTVAVVVLGLVTVLCLAGSVPFVLMAR